MGQANKERTAQQAQNSEKTYRLRLVAPPQLGPDWSLRVHTRCRLETFGLKLQPTAPEIGDKAFWMWIRTVSESGSFSLDLRLLSSLSSQQRVQRDSPWWQWCPR